jgi:hypothetical protein
MCRVQYIIMIRHRPQALRPGQTSHWFCTICGEDVKKEEIKMHRCSAIPYKK